MCGMTYLLYPVEKSDLQGSEWLSESGLGYIAEARSWVLGDSFQTKVSNS